MKSLLQAVCFGFFCISIVQAADPQPSIKTVYLKNNSKSRGDIWVNGYYQGYVPSGSVLFTVSDGFVTNDSRYLSTGENYQIESHAGWTSSPELKVTIKTYDGKGGVATTVQNLSSALYGEEPSISFGDTDPGPAMEDTERENSGPILKGTAQSFNQNDEELAPALDRKQALEKKIKDIEKDIRAITDQLALNKQQQEQNTANDAGIAELRSKLAKARQGEWIANHGPDFETNPEIFYVDDELVSRLESQLRTAQEALAQQAVGGANGSDQLNTRLAKSNADLKKAKEDLAKILTSFSSVKASTQSKQDRLKKESSRRSLLDDLDSPTTSSPNPNSGGLLDSLGN